MSEVDAKVDGPGVAMKSDAGGSGGAVELYRR
jgi:hypothetical protein